MAPRPLDLEHHESLVGVWSRRAGRTLMAMGVLLGMFLAYEFLLTPLQHNRAQHALLTRFQQALPTTRLDKPVPLQSSDWAGVAVAAPGDPVALIDIPRIGVHEVVVEGTAPDQLRGGPGHLRDTPLPGEFGNAVLAGHRTTYGAPFGQLDQLRSGDHISVVTGQGSFTYTVTAVGTVNSGDADVVYSTLDSRLTLITSDPAYEATSRLAVVAGLDGLPADLPVRSYPPLGSGELGLAGDGTALAAAVLWAQLLALTVWLIWWLRSRLPALVRYLFGVPVVLTVMVLLFSSFDRLLPGTL